MELWPYMVGAYLGQLALFLLLWFRLEHLQNQIGRMKDIIDGHLSVITKLSERIKRLEE